jgi:signal transduction histidine kinase
MGGRNCPRHEQAMLLNDYRSAGRSSARTERVLAVGRAFLTVTGLLAIYMDPTEPARLREVTYAVLLGYAVYSLAVAAYVHSGLRLTPRLGTTLHGLDLLWTSALTFVSDGPLSPFFLFFLLVVVSAAYRWGFRETVGTALTIASVFVFQAAVAAFHPLEVPWFAPADFELNRTILRAAYLLVAGVLLGYLAGQQKQSRAELVAILDVTRQPRVHLGLGGSITAVGRVLLSTFNARAVVVVIHDDETRRTLSWQLERRTDGSDAPHVRRVEIAAAEHATWLFQDAGRAWHAVAGRGGAAQIWATEPDAWPLTRLDLELPAAFLGARSFHTVSAANLGLHGEWRGRIYLFDVADTTSLARILHFLEALADHVTPALTNVFLFRRLRARAGAVERARVARELHDGAIQSLFGIEMKLEAIRRELPRARSVEAELAEVQHLLRREVLSLRELMQALKPIEIDSGDQLPDVLASLVERFRRDTGISARFVSNGGRMVLSPARAIEMVRIVQEALVNVRKHSRAHNVLVRLTATGGNCSLVIEDDGCGFPFDGRLSATELDERRLGPAIIRERARIAGAALAVDSTPGRGSRVEVAFSEVAHA